MKRRSRLLVLLLVLLLLVTGCVEKEIVETNGEKVNVGKMQHKHCTRLGNADGAEVNLNYDLYYTDDILNILKSEEQVVSESSDILTTYEDAYKQIHSNYQGLDYYDANVVRENNSVTSTITINYDKVDINRLIAIEGEEDNIFEDGKAKVDKWLELAKRLGAKCTDVTEEENSEA